MTTTDLSIQNLLALVDRDRLRDTLFDMVRIPSPTGDTRTFAEHVAHLLRESSLADVGLIDTPDWPDSPAVVAWRRGRGRGPTLQFSGHLDHIHQPHAAPTIAGDRIYGRGAADMKSGLACMVEVARVLDTAGIELPGDLLFTAHDLHEAPVGYGEGLRSLLCLGIVGDAVIVTEGPSDAFHIAGKSQSVFEITLTLPGDPIHELAVSPETPNLVELGAEVISALTQLRTRIAQRCDEVLGPETLFLGQIAAGDFYNRLPTVCRIVGTWRYPPETTRDAVAAELHEVVLSTVEDRPVCVSVDGSQGNEGFRVSLDEPIAQALHAAYHQVTGSPLANGVQLFAADNGKFINWAHVPAVAHGVGLSQAHADIEWCDAADLERLAKVLLATTVEYYS